MKAVISNQPNPAQFLIILFFGRFIPLSLAIGGGLVVFFGYNQLQQGLESRKWPQVTGLIESSRIDTVVTTDSDGHRVTNFDIVAEYKYTVEDQDFENDIIQFGSMSYGSRSKAEEALKQYKAGMEVDVFYKPMDPQTSVLIKGAGTGSYIALVIGCILFVAGLVFFFLLPIIIRNGLNKA